MAIPSGKGTEVLKNVSGQQANSAASALTAGTNEIILIMSFYIYSTASLTTNSLAKVMCYNGSADITIWLQTIPGFTTFTWNDPIVLHPTHILKISEHNNVAMNWWVSYLVQDWT